MRDLVRSLQGEAGQPTPLDQAHDILLRAYQEPDEQRRVQLAQDALAISPDCADAYVLLAEHATSRKEALRLAACSASRTKASAQSGQRARASWASWTRRCSSGSW